MQLIEIALLRFYYFYHLYLLIAFRLLISMGSSAYQLLSECTLCLLNKIFTDEQKKYLFSKLGESNMTNCTAVSTEKHELIRAMLYESSNLRGIQARAVNNKSFCCMFSSSISFTNSLVISFSSSDNRTNKKNFEFQLLQKSVIGSCQKQKT